MISVRGLDIKLGKRPEPLIAAIREHAKPYLDGVWSLSNSMKDGEAKKTPGYLFEFYWSAIRTVLTYCSETGHGAAFLFEDESSPAGSCSYQYRVDSAVLGSPFTEVLSSYIRITEGVGYGAQSPDQYRLCVEEFLRAARNTVGLASVDGVLGLGPALSVIGFGGKLNVEIDELPVQLVTIDGSRTSIKLSDLGMRKASMMASLRNAPSGLGIVVSSDGDMYYVIGGSSELVAFDL